MGIIKNVFWFFSARYLSKTAILGQQNRAPLRIAGLTCSLLTLREQVINSLEKSQRFIEKSVKFSNISNI